MSPGIGGTTLRLAPQLAVPLDVATQKLAFLGRTGSGKTYGATKLAELLLVGGAQVIALDPVGVWYGLRLDGKGPGFAIPVFGGLHGDLPLEPTAGALIADVVVERGISAILDVSQFETNAAKARFAHAFADRFFFLKKARPSAVHLFLEECQEFVPQNPERDEAAMLGSFARLAKLGRNFGIGVSLVSQRPQEINKKVLNMTELLLAFQMRGPQERKTIKEWSSDKDIGVDIVGELPSLKVGECFASSPQWLDFEGKIKIAPKQSADVSSTPQVGAAARGVEQLTPVDLEQLRTAMAATIEKVEAEDPKLLRKKIAELQRQLEGKGKAPTSMDLSPAEVKKVADDAVRERERAFDRERRELRAGLTAAQAALVSIGNAALKLPDEIAAAAKAVRGALDVIPASHSSLSAAPPASSVPRSLRRPPASVEGMRRDELPHVTATEQKILDALRTLQEFGIAPAERVQVAIMSGYAQGGHFNNLLGSLRTAGLLRYPSEGMLELTEIGIAKGVPMAQFETREDLHQFWLGKVAASEAKLLRVLLSVYPDPINRAALGAHTGYTPGGHFNNMLGRLRTLGLATYPADGQVRAADVLFPAGLR